MKQLNFVFVLAVVLAVSPINVFAQAAAKPGCVMTVEGGEFCPSATSPVVQSAAQQQPLDEQINEAAAKGGKVMDALRNLYQNAGRTQQGVVPAPQPVNPAVSYWSESAAVILLIILILGALIWALTRNRRPQQSQGTGQVEGDHLVVRHPLNVKANPINLNATVTLAGAPAPIPPPLVPAPIVPQAPPLVPAAPAVGIPQVAAVVNPGQCQTCGRRFARGSRFCLNCGSRLVPLIVLSLLLFGVSVQNASAQTTPSNRIEYKTRVNGVEGWYTPPASVVHPAPRPVVHRSVTAAPAPMPKEFRQVVESLNGLVDLMKQNVQQFDQSVVAQRASNPSSPAVPIQVSNTGVTQEMADRLGSLESSVHQDRGRLNELTNGLGEVRGRLGTVEKNEAQDRDTIADLGAAFFTKSKTNFCRSYVRMLNQHQVAPDKKAMKECKVNE